VAAPGPELGRMPNFEFIKVVAAVVFALWELAEWLDKHM
jgi:hypothetical protein